MTIFMIAFSTFFAFIVPAGVGLYWAWGNLFAIGVMYLVNVIYSPKKYINYDALPEDMKKQAAEEKATAKKNKALAKKYYKQFFLFRECRQHEACLLFRGQRILQVLQEPH